MASASERLYVARSGSSATNTTAVSVSASTSKTVVGVLGGATDTICLKRFKVSFPSVTAADLPATVEVGIITAAGTSTSFTPVQIQGKALTSSASGGYNYTAEPTYSKVFESLYVPVNNGLYDYTYPLGEEPSCDASQGFAIRITLGATPTSTTVLASLTYSE